MEESLRRHHLAGRLTLEEFEDRVARAQKAVTLGDLDALQVDLPAPPARAPSPPPRPSVVPGRAGFAERIELGVPASRAHAHALATIVPAMVRAGYGLEERSDDRLAFVRRRRPAWTIVVAIVFFPFGLFALLVRDEERVSVEFDALPDGCAVLIHGVAPLTVRRAFAELRA